MSLGFQAACSWDFSGNFAKQNPMTTSLRYWQYFNSCKGKERTDILPSYWWWQERWDPKSLHAHMLLKLVSQWHVGWSPANHPANLFQVLKLGVWWWGWLIKRRICYFWGGDMAKHCWFLSFPCHRLDYTTEKEFTQRQIMLKPFRNN